ncbi:MAG: hypothetical protein CVU69_00885 [Deltaproteobacteria bacterium HGW-Deltaproteobacteria-4]|nr:MAG: hypothetical protein CVU69_00885 [Deltaproteobacteria bacterium HGW-Deltaproteobacteria-4]
MIIEIRKAGFVNKGAQLMLYAVLQKMQQTYPDATFVMAPSPESGSQPFHKLVGLGMYPKAWLWLFGIQWGILAGFLPKKLREMYGIVLDKEVDVVLDAAGFSYSDQLGVDSSKELACSSSRWKKQGTKLILLPQAFGPYTNNNIRLHVAKFIENAALVFPREKVSYDYLVDVVGEQEKIKQFPDFTNLINGILPDYFDVENNKTCLVPNYRMIDMTIMEESEAYLPFMIKCAKYLVENDAKPFILVHEGANDMILATSISDAVGGIPVIKEDDPLKIKGILGACEATVGSRYHGLVSALSQGVPSLATGWSHKYLELFEEYGFPEGVVSVIGSDDELYKKIDFIIDPETKQALSSRLKEKSEEIKKLSEKMWKNVFSEIDKK